MKDSAFRKYDIRGKVGTELLIEDVYNFGRALAFYLQQKNDDFKNISIAMDGRTHSPEIRDELVKALLDSGFNVTFIGVCPTPVLYFSTYHLNVDGGVMITASHNPKEYNGFKIVLKNTPLHDQEIQELKNAFKTGQTIKSVRKGKYKEEYLHEAYLDQIEERFPHLKDSKFSAVIDCGNGAAGTIIPALLDRMAWKNSHYIFEDVDGNYPNHEADPSEEKNMQDIKKHLEQNDQFHLGIGFDGDVDRIGVMTRNGELLPCDKLIAIFSKFIIPTKPNAAIVFDVRCSSALHEFLTKLGARSLMSQCGAAFIKKMMLEEDGMLGGELSGHFCFRDKHEGYDDAIYAMMRLAELLHTTEQTIEEHLEEFPQRFCSPEFRLNCKEEDKLKIIDKVVNEFKKNKDYQLDFIDGVSFKNSTQWGIIRPSNTQSVISLRLEGTTKEELKIIKRLIAETVMDYFDRIELEDIFEI